MLYLAGLQATQPSRAYMRRRARARERTHLANGSALWTHPGSLLNRPNLHLLGNRPPLRSPLRPHKTRQHHPMVESPFLDLEVTFPLLNISPEFRQARSDAGLDRSRGDIAAAPRGAKLTHPSQQTRNGRGMHCTYTPAVCYCRMKRRESWYDERTADTRSFRPV